MKNYLCVRNRSGILLVPRCKQDERLAHWLKTMSLKYVNIKLNKLRQSGELDTEEACEGVSRGSGFERLKKNSRCIKVKACLFRSFAYLYAFHFSLPVRVSFFFEYLRKRAIKVLFMEWGRLFDEDIGNFHARDLISVGWKLLDHSNAFSSWNSLVLQNARLSMRSYVEFSRYNIFDIRKPINRKNMIVVKSSRAMTLLNLDIFLYVFTSLVICSGSSMTIINKWASSIPLLAVNRRSWRRPIVVFYAETHLNASSRFYTEINHGRM